MKFADFHVGQILIRGPVSLSADDITRFAREWDPQWFHTDPEAAGRGPFHGLIASGWQTCAVAMRMAFEAALDGSESFASPGVANIHWPRPVRPDEPLMWRAEVLEVRRSAQKPHLGIVRWRWWLLTEQGGHEVLDLEATSLFRLPAVSPTP